MNKSKISIAINNCEIHYVKIEKLLDHETQGRFFVSKHNKYANGFKIGNSLFVFGENPRSIARWKKQNINTMVNHNELCNLRAHIHNELNYLKGL